MTLTGVFIYFKGSFGTDPYFFIVDYLSVI